MRVVSVHSPNDNYGASRALTRMAAHFVARGHDFVAVIPPDGPLGSALERVGARVVPCANLISVERARAKGLGLLRITFQTISSAFAMARLLTRERPDIVHCNTSVILTGPFGAALTGLPLIWHLRESFSEFPKQWAIYQRLMLAISSRVICVSKQVASQFAVRSPKVRVAYDGISTTGLRILCGDERSCLRARYGLDRKLVVGVVGRIKLGRKGQDVFLRAAAHIAKSYPNVIFAAIGSAYVGNDDHVTRMHALAQELGLADQFIHLPEFEDQNEIYGLCDIVVMPSGIPEPFGLVVSEAMVRGLPVIATNAGGAKEQIVAGETGFLFEIADDAALAAQMKRLIENPALRRTVGEAGRARALSAFAAEPNYDRLIEIFAEACTSG